MEDRVTEGRGGRGVSLIALGTIGAITVAWWALALWPVGASQPEWLARTRAACFGAERGGLPDAGGWILLIGEPVGIAALLWVLYGRALRDDVRWVRARPLARSVTVVFFGAMVLVAGAAGVRIAQARANAAPITIGVERPVRTNLIAPSVRLVDQRERGVSLAALAGPVIVTFAYGHCATVCPLTVTSLREARRARRRDIPIVVVTVDPWRDTPDRLPSIARSWALSDGDFVLSGSTADVSRVLDALGVGRRRNETNGDVEHAATALLMRPGGRVVWRIDGAPAAFASLMAVD